MTAAHKSESPVAAGQVAEGSAENVAIVAPEADADKTLTTLKAKLAWVGGHAVYDLADGGYLVVSTKWAGMCREVPDLRALAAFARQIGACA